MWEALDRLEHVAATASKARLASDEVTLGLNFEPHGLAHDKSLREFYAPTSTTYFDWMHWLLASGGLGQYHINGFVREARET
eukprot:8099574-Pyramimonas_sp.AAC.1